MAKLTDYINKRLLFFVIISSIPAIIYGWEVGMVNIILSMRSSFGEKFGLYKFVPRKGYIETDDKPIREMFITPSFTVGGIVGSFFVLYLLDSIGRCKTLILAAFIYLIGVATQVSCTEIIQLCIGRFVAGIASALSLCVSPIYIAENAPKEIRGTLGIVNSLGIQIGMLFASLWNTLCLKLITNNTAQWRTALCGLILPVVLFVIFVWFLKETPRYLVMKNKDEQAHKNLAYVRNKDINDPAVANEFNEMSTKIKVELSDGMCSWKELFSTKSIIYRVIIVAVLQLLHMLVGINAIGYYSTQVYEKYLDISLQKYGAWLATLQNFISFICTFPAMKYIEKFGRKALLKWGSFGLGLCMVAIYGLCHLCDATGHKVFGWLCVIVIYIYVIIYSWSWSSTVFVFVAELFPIRMRAKANTIAGIFQYLGSAVVGAFTTNLMKHLSFYTFLIFAGFCLIAFVFTQLCVRETKGISLEDMDKLYGDNSIKEKEEFKQEINECFQENATKA